MSATRDTRFFKDIRDLEFNSSTAKSVLRRLKSEYGLEVDIDHVMVSCTMPMLEQIFYDGTFAGSAISQMRIPKDENRFVGKINKKEFKGKDFFLFGSLGRIGIWLPEQYRNGWIRFLAALNRRTRPYVIGHLENYVRGELSKGSIPSEADILKHKKFVSSSNSTFINKRDAVEFLETHVFESSPALLPVVSVRCFTASPIMYPIDEFDSRSTLARILDFAKGCTVSNAWFALDVGLQVCLVDDAVHLCRYTKTEGVVVHESKEDIFNDIDVAEDDCTESDDDTNEAWSRMQGSGGFGDEDEKEEEKEDEDAKTSVPISTGDGEQKVQDVENVVADTMDATNIGVDGNVVDAEGGGDEDEVDEVYNLKLGKVYPIHLIASIKKHNASRHLSTGVDAASFMDANDILPIDSNLSLPGNGTFLRTSRDNKVQYCKVYASLHHIMRAISLTPPFIGKSGTYLDSRPREWQKKFRDYIIGMLVAFHKKEIEAQQLRFEFRFSALPASEDDLYVVLLKNLKKVCENISLYPIPFNDLAKAVTFSAMRFQKESGVDLGIVSESTSLRTTGRSAVISGAMNGMDLCCFRQDFSYVTCERKLHPMTKQTHTAYQNGIPGRRFYAAVVELLNTLGFTHPQAVYRGGKINMCAETYD